MANDITIYETGDGGDISLINEDISTVDGFTNMILLAWFGGNIEASTTENQSEQERRNDWWGNQYFNADNQFNSELERTLKDTSVNTNGLSKIENAAKKDLLFLKAYGEIEVNAYIVAENRIEIEAIMAEPDNKSLKSTFLWDATKNTIINDNTIS